MSDDVERLLGRPPRALAAFAADYRDALTGCAPEVVVSAETARRRRTRLTDVPDRGQVPIAGRITRHRSTTDGSGR
ncbi:hypothetical protein [Halalkalicoccus ordinarius]|uniref:hypothetical protein n=1 Tax=Halalkalicoccus ordinarius TaxID=3116651 RepID=UPI00300F2BDB